MHVEVLGFAERRRERAEGCHIVSKFRQFTSLRAYMTAKQNHCIPTCAIPRSPAAHSNALICRQHATSARDAGRTSILAKALVPEVVPRSMK